ncbi:sensor histidine kinase [Methylovorus menthalis]|nr:histidine kinase [Methylovorus menthalis]
MTSIKQKPGLTLTATAPGALQKLPDFRNPGIALRILLLVNLLMLLSAAVQSTSLPATLSHFTEQSAFGQPALLLSLLVLYLTYPWLLRVPYAVAMLLAGVFAMLVVTLLYIAGVNILGMEALPLLSRLWLLSFLTCAITGYYLHLRYRSMSPAMAEARLQALQARIRPHFLFNSLNAVLSLVRSQPQRAEAALEDMAELFRVLMADNRELVPLAQEISLCRQYLALEKLRLDERLLVTWQIDSMPPDAMVPPLVLQPLLENAVYHGIEPLSESGEIIIKIYTVHNEVHLLLSNPLAPEQTRTSGNKMALANIRERLALHFDIAATLSSSVRDGRYEVHIMLPYHRHG